MTRQILNLIADQMDLLIMINQPENHAVTFLSQSAEWLFGIKRETISCAEDLLKRLNLDESDSEVRKFCKEQVKYTSTFEHAFVPIGAAEPMWIMVRIAPGEEGENILLIQDVTMLHKTPEAKQERVRNCLQQIMPAYQMIQLMLNQKEDNWEKFTDEKMDDNG